MIETERLVLQPLAPHHVAAVHGLAGDRAIADTMISVPHPLVVTDVERWLAFGSEATASSPHRDFAACRRADR
jgi:hypothetical protein